MRIWTQIFSDFLEIVRIVMHQGKLRLFPYTLRDAILEWLDVELDGSIIKWEKLIRKFCNKIFSPAKDSKNQIENSNIPTGRW